MQSPSCAPAPPRTAHSLNPALAPPVLHGWELQLQAGAQPQLTDAELMAMRLAMDSAADAVGGLIGDCCARAKKKWDETSTGDKIAYGANLAMASAIGYRYVASVDQDRVVPVVGRVVDQES
jgi:hypothetical protein